MSEHVHSHDCKVLLGSLSEYIDGELRADLCALIEEHVKDCENCRIVVDTLRKTITLYHATTASPEVPEDVRERLYRRLNLSDLLKPKETSAEGR